MKKVDLEKLLNILNNNMKTAVITPEQMDVNLFEVGMDSIVFIQIIVAIEEAFECEIPDSKLMISEMNTVNKIIEVLNSIEREW